MTPKDTTSLVDDIRSIVADWRVERPERLQRRSLHQRDFDALREAGFLRTVVPKPAGGLWQDSASSARVVCEVLRILATGDPAVALVAAMHPSVVAFWLLNPDPSQPEWEAQREAVFASAAAGEQWGTITSEPGSGGDISRTKATATPSDGPAFMSGRAYGVSGDKHFGSGSGVADRMITTAIPEGEDAPTIFALDTTDRTWNGSAGFTLLAEWDGIGMAATQSHAMRLDRAHGVRLARHGPLSDVAGPAGAFIATTFIAVIVGMLDEAVTVAKHQLRPRLPEMRAYEQVEWTRAITDHWLAVQAYEGSLRAIEAGDENALFAALCAKESVAELAEATLGRLARVIGGGSFSLRSPFAHWYEDVRALGFLRPPWGLAYDNLLALSLA
jgi:alkylation response protein AidB-like acyl-CoA dehydrogenase